MISASSPLSRKYSPMVQPEYGAINCSAAVSDAAAETTMVCSIAPCSSSLRTTAAMLDAFCPHCDINTFDPGAFLVDDGIHGHGCFAGLPVSNDQLPSVPGQWGPWNRWIFNPICTGWSTDFRAITPGAIFSMGDVAAASIGPLPSMGRPRESTTRPSRSSPMGHFQYPPGAFHGVAF